MRDSSGLFELSKSSGNLGAVHVQFLGDVSRPLRPVLKLRQDELLNRELLWDCRFLAAALHRFSSPSDLNGSCDATQVCVESFILAVLGDALETCRLPAKLREPGAVAAVHCFHHLPVELVRDRLRARPVALGNGCLEVCTKRSKIDEGGRAHNENVLRSVAGVNKMSLS